MATVIVAHRKKNGSVEPSHEQGQHTPELMSAAEGLIRALESKSASGVASALQNAFAILDSDSQEEETQE